MSTSRPRVGVTWLDLCAAADMLEAESARVMSTGREPSAAPHGTNAASMRASHGILGESASCLDNVPENQQVAPPEHGQAIGVRKCLSDNISRRDDYAAEDAMRQTGPRRTRREADSPLRKEESATNPGAEKKPMREGKARRTKRKTTSPSRKDDSDCCITYGTDRESVHKTKSRRTKRKTTSPSRKDDLGTHPGTEKDSSQGEKSQRTRRKTASSTQKDDSAATQALERDPSREGESQRTERKTTSPSRKQDNATTNVSTAKLPSRETKSHLLKRRTASPSRKVDAATSHGTAEDSSQRVKSQRSKQKTASSSPREDSATRFNTVKDSRRDTREPRRTEARTASLSRDHSASSHGILVQTSGDANNTVGEPLVVSTAQAVSPRAESNGTRPLQSRSRSEAVEPVVLSDRSREQREESDAGAHAPVQQPTQDPVQQRGVIRLRGVVLPSREDPLSDNLPRGRPPAHGPVKAGVGCGDGAHRSRSQVHGPAMAGGGGGGSGGGVDGGHRARPVQSQEEGKFVASLNRVNHLESRIGALLERDVTLRTIPSIISASEQLKVACCELLLQHGKRSLAARVDQKLWRCACYSVVEALRSRSGSSQDVQTHLLNFIEHSKLLLLGLVEKLQTQCGFCLEDVVDQERSRIAVQSKAKIGAILCHNCFIWAGDLARYQQQALKKEDWSVARKYYLQAVNLAPRNGKPYNQLAILAVYTRRKLDAVLYYVRSLSVKTPILTAKESLLGLFDDIARKTRLLEQQQEQVALDEKRKEEKRMRRQAAGKAYRDRHRVNHWGSDDEQDNGDSTLKEVWVYPATVLNGAALSRVPAVPSDGSGRSPGAAVSFAGLGGDAAKTLPSPPLLRKRSVSADTSKRLKKYIVLRFLRLHGMLHTKIGMEHFARVRTSFQRDLSELMLHFEDESMTCVKMMVINVYALNRILSTAAGPVLPLYRETLQVTALLMELLVAACNEQVGKVERYLSSHGTTLPELFLSEHGASVGTVRASAVDGASVAVTSPPSVSVHTVPGLAKLSALLPAVWIGLAWIDCKPAERIAEFPWQGLATLLNSLLSWPLSSFVDDFDESCGRPALTPPEDHFLNGFMPLQTCLDMMPLTQPTLDGFSQSVLHLAVRAYYLLACATSVGTKELSVVPCLRLEAVADGGGDLCYVVSGSPDEDATLAGDQSARTSHQVLHVGGDGNDDDDDDDDDVVILNEISCGSSDEVTSDENDDDDEARAGSRDGVHQEKSHEGGDISDAIAQLKARRDELRKQIREEDEYQKHVKGLVDAETALPCIVMTVTPKYLVLDTNCFISFLTRLQKLVDSAHFIFVIPLVVINELDGLKRGGQTAEESASREEHVSVAARSALAFLEEKFADRRQRDFRAMTNQGTLLNTIAFRSECGNAADYDDGNNDDIILNCARQLCNAAGKGDVEPDKKVVVQMERKVVLLTNDRNLRLKAHLYHIPVRAMASFMQWFESQG